MPSTPKQTDTTQTTKVELPAWVDEGGQENYSLAKDVASAPFQAVSGPLSAGMANGYRRSAYTNMFAGERNLNASLADSTALAQDAVSDNPAPVGLGGYSPGSVGLGDYSPTPVGLGGYSAATVGLGGYEPSMVQSSTVGLGGYDPSMVRAQQVSGPSSVKDIFAADIGKSNIDKYMNPYEDDVVKSAQTAGQQSIDASQRANSDSAIAAGAFGSSRHGVTEGVTAAQGAQDIAQTVAGVRSAGFNTALQAAQSDAARTDAMSTANQSKDLAFQDLLSRIGIANQGADLTAQTANQGALADRARMQLAADQGNQSSDLAAQTANQGALADRARMGLAADQGNQNAYADQARMQLAADQGNQNAYADRAKMQLAADQGNQSAYADQARMQLAADQGNQSAQAQAIAQRLQAAGIVSGNASTRSDYSKAVAGMLGNDALIQQQTQQSALDRINAQKQAEIDYPTQQLNLRLAALGMTPYGKTTSSSGSSTTSGGDNPFMTALGGMTSIGGLFGFSDPKLKKNVKTIGRGTKGLPVKEFEYRQDKGVALPKGKQIGYMADDVEKVMPDAVRKVPIGKGKTAKQVDYSKTGRPGLFGFSRSKAA